MNLNEVVDLLHENNFSFTLHEFENEAAYRRHIVRFPNTENAKDCKVCSVRLKSPNAHKNMELQFNLEQDDFVLEDLYFGEFGFELFDRGEDGFADALLQTIRAIMAGELTVAVCYDIKHRRLLWDAAFDVEDQRRFENAFKKIKQRKRFFERFFKAQKQYEIFDWNTYQCIMR